MLLTLTFASIMDIIAIAVFYYSIQYLDRLKEMQCVCALDETVPRMRTLMMVLIGFSMLNIVMRLFFMSLPELLMCKLGKSITAAFALVLTSMQIYLFVSFLQWKKRLVDEACECSMDRRRDIMEMYAWFRIASIVILLFIAVGAMTSLGMMAASKQGSFQSEMIEGTFDRSLSMKKFVPATAKQIGSMGKKASDYTRDGVDAVGKMAAASIRGVRKPKGPVRKPKPARQ